MFSDGEIGLKMAYDRNMRNYAGQAQAIVDAKNDQIADLQRALAAARTELRDERAKRLAAEIRLERVLDMPA